MTGTNFYLFRGHRLPGSVKTALQLAASAADMCSLSQSHISGQTRGNVSILVPEKQSRQGLFLVAFQVQCGWLTTLNQSLPFQSEPK